MSGIPPNTFKRRLADRTLQIGFWLGLNSSMATEIAAGGGFDWVLLDMEHNPIGIESVERHLLAARHGGEAEFVVRLPSIDPVLVKRLLDCGVRSFMFPFVQSVEEARLAVASTRYPPHGIRGFSGTHRGNRFGLDADYLQRAHDDICVIVQIESPAAIDAIPEIGAVEGIDGVLVGPNDLAANMGFLGKTGEPVVRARIEDALRLIEATPAAPGILDFDPQSAGALLKKGYTFIAVGGDWFTLISGIRTLLDSVATEAKD